MHTYSTRRLVVGTNTTLFEFLTEEISRLL